MAITAEELRVKVTADTKGAEGGLERVEGKSKGLKDGFGIAKAAAVSFATGAAASFAGKLIGAASDLNETVSKTGVVFGGQTGQVTAYAQQMADDFGLPKTAVLDAASSFGLLGQAAGVTGKPLADMSTNLTGLAADAMSFYNVPLDQALGDFSSALSGESEPVKKYGVLMNEAAVQTEALALGIVKPVANTKKLAQAQLTAKVAQDAYTKAVQKHGPKSIEAQKAQAALAKAQDAVAAAAKGTVPPLTEGQKVQARYSLISKGLSKAHGDLARTQSSVANQAKMLQGRVQNLAADMGQKLLPAASAVLGGLIGLVSALPQVAGFLKDNATTIGIVAGIIGAVLLPMLIQWGVQSTIAAAKSVAAWVTTQTAALTSSWAQVGAGIRVVAGWVAMGAQAALAAARVVAGWVLMGVQSMIQAVRMAAAWVIAMGPIGWVIAAVIALVALIIANWDTIRNATVAAWGAIVNWVKGAWEWIKNAVAAGARFVMAMVMAQWNALKAGTSAIWNGIKAVISGAVNGAKAVVSSVVNGIKSAVSAAWNWIKSTTSSTWNSIKTGVSTAVSGMLGVVRGIPGKIKGALGNLGSMLLSSGKAIIDGLAQGIRNGLGNVTGAVRDVLSKARNLLPFSPAKEGPFSGRGWSLYSGRSITKALADGMVDEASGLRKAALGVARAAVPPVRGVTAPGVTLGPVRGSAAVSGALRPSEMQGVGAGRSTNITMTTYYPIQEKESQAVNRNLQRIAALPLG